MSITAIFIKLIGLALALVGCALILACVGVSLFGVSFMMYGVLGQFIMGVILLGGGIYILKGGTPTL